MKAFSLHLTSDSLEDAGGLRRAVVDGEKMTLTRYEFQAGASFPQHRHDEEQLTLCLSGRLDFTVDGEEHRLTEGGILVIPGGSSHGAVAGEHGAEVVCVVTPKRSGTDSMEILEKA